MTRSMAFQKMVDDKADALNISASSLADLHTLESFADLVLAYTILLGIYRFREFVRCRRLLQFQPRGTQIDRKRFSDPTLSRDWVGSYAITIEKLHEFSDKLGRWL